ncbi:MAG: MFS transporter [Actinomycetota bacterium]
MQQRSPAAILAATIAAAMLVVANVSVLNVALPELSVELGATQAEGQWMIDIYAVVLASLLLPIGAIGDKFGRRLILLIGLAILTAANVVTIFLDTPTQLIVARAISGLGAAFVFPATLSTITATLPEDKRSRGVAMWTASVSMGGIIGVLVSGALIESFWWGSLFLTMAIASAVVLVICYLAVPTSSDPDEANLDPIGAVLSAVGLGALVLGIIEGPVKGWTSTIALTGLIGGALAFAAFVAWELRTARPLLDVRLFRRQGTRAGSFSVFIQFTGMFGMFFLVVFYLSVVRGFGPLDTGLALLPIGLGVFPASAAAIPLASRFGRRAVGATGLGLMAGGFLVGAVIDIDSSIWHYYGALVVMGLGFGLAGPPATEAIVESLPRAQQGVASALNDVLREVGAAIGIAVAGSAFNAAYRSSVADVEPDWGDAFGAIEESPFAALQVGLGAPPEQGGPLIQSVQQATLDGWGRGMLVSAAVVAIGAVAFFAWAPRHRKAELQADVKVAPPPTWTPAPDVAPALADLRRLYSTLEHALDVLSLRAAIPTDMATWPMDEQFRVASKASAAMESPVQEIDALAAVIADRVATAQADVATVVSQSWPSDLVHGDVVALAGYSARCIRLADGLHARFLAAAPGLPPLIATAERLAAVRSHVARAEAGVHAWTSAQAPLDLTRPEVEPSQTVQA